MFLILAGLATDQIVISIVSVLFFPSDAQEIRLIKKNNRRARETPRAWNFDVFRSYFSRNFWCLLTAMDCLTMQQIITDVLCMIVMNTQDQL